MLHLPHVEPLTQFVKGLRAKTGLGNKIPYLDPLDGGIDARCLFVFEAPGGKAVESGFVSRNNDDESAKNWFVANADAEIPRQETASWNIIPWYIGTGNKIRSAKADDLRKSLEYLDDLLNILPYLEIVVLVGNTAGSKHQRLKESYPRLEFLLCSHPSLQNLNRNPKNRAHFVESVRQVAGRLKQRP